MTVRFCRDCANFEDRRDIDGVALCTQLYGPFTCCEEFELKDKSLSENRTYNKFCAECVNFQEIDGIPVCAKGHNPGIACESFVERFEKLKAIEQNNQAKTALLVYTITDNKTNPEIPDFLIEISRKIKW